MGGGEEVSLRPSVECSSEVSCVLVLVVVWLMALVALVADKEEAVVEEEPSR